MISHRSISFSWSGVGGPSPQVSGDWRVFMRCEGTWNVRGGLRPDVNSLLISADQYALLPTTKLNLYGTIELWAENDPEGVSATPDVALANMTLVDIAIERVGMTPEDVAPRALAYRLSFADHRHAWVEPRGGRLREGLGNPPDGDPDEWATNAEMADVCLTVMGAATTAPSSMDDVEPLLDLDWRFAHAPGELERLLGHTGHVYCPQPPTGAGNIQLAGWGSLPTFSGSIEIYNIPLDAMDRRAQTLIITSGVTPVVRTYDGEADPAPAWEFVAQDPDDGFKWKALADITQVGADPLAAWRRDLPDATDEHREGLLDQVYRCIRLDPTRFPVKQCPLLPEAELPDGTRQPASILLAVALHTSGGWENVTARIPASQVLPEHGVMQFAQALVQVDPSPAGDLKLSAIAIDEAHLKPTFSVEDWDDTNAKRSVGCWGFNLLTSTPSPILEATALSYLSGYRPTVAVLVRPELRRVWLNDTTSNDTALAALAETYAAAHLAEATTTAREIKLRGFQAVGISSRVNEVSYDLGRVTTTLQCDGWQLPRVRSRQRRSYATEFATTNWHYGGVV